MTVSLAQDVEQAVAGGDAETRRAMLRRMTELFVDTAERLRDDQVTAFDTVILKLAQSVESAARAALSGSLADLANAPRGVVRDLAFDPDLGVAGPVLSRSPQVAEDDLVGIAQARGQGHLHTLSRRRPLSERVTDLLVARGDGTVIRSVAGNDGARFSAQGFDALARHAAADEALRDVLSLRRDVPAEHAADLVATAKTRVATAKARVAQSPAGETLSLPEAGMRVDAWLRGRGEPSDAPAPDEADIVAWLAEGRVMEALVGLARAACMPPDLVLQAYQGAHSDPLLFLVRSLRFGWGTCTALLLSKPGEALSPEAMRGLSEAFQALPVAKAQRVVRFTAAREPMQKPG